MTLVDTQTVIWMTQDDARLSDPAKEILSRGRREGTLAIADVTLREVSMLVWKARVTLPISLGAYLAFIESMFTVIPIDSVIAERSVRFSKNYPNDPADQLIGATAVVRGMALVTVDQEIRNSGEVECIW